MPQATRFRCSFFRPFLLCLDPGGQEQGPGGEAPLDRQAGGRERRQPPSRGGRWRTVRRSGPSLMAGTREAQLAEITPVSRKHAAAPILARRVRCSEICPALTMQHSKPFRLLRQGAFWAGRHSAKRWLARLRKELCAPAALFTRVCGKDLLRTSLFRRGGSNTFPIKALRRSPSGAVPT
jgi:hypothetical protein